ncbi:MAG: hypothetical protein ACM3MK_00670 [Chitinophagales bacterium]
MNNNQEQLKNLKQELGNLDKMIDETIDSLQFGTGGYEKLTGVIEKMDEQFKGIGEIKDRVSEEDVAFFKRLLALSQETNAILVRLIEAMSAGDVVLLVDLMQYELKERIEKWTRLISRLEISMN